MVPTARSSPSGARVTGTSLTRSAVVYFPTMQRASVEVRALVAERDPELLEGVDEVDRTLIRAWLDRDPWERVRMGLGRHASLMGMRRCLRANSTR